MNKSYHKIVLNNGLKVFLSRMPGRNSLSLGIFIKVGGRYEDNENKGSAHFLEHLLFKGTKNYSCRNIKESIEGVGGMLNGFTSEELTCYLVKVSSRYSGKAFKVLSDMVIRPLLPEVEVKKERGVILEELKMYRDLPQSYVYELLDGLLWPKQPLGLPIIGTVNSISQVTRDSLLSFWSRYYTPSNILISASGDIDIDKLSKEIDREFALLPKGKDSVFTKAKTRQSSAQIKAFYKDTEQTHIALGFKALKRGHPLRQALTLLHILLGANMSSRLFNEIREKRGLAYGISTAVKRFYDTGAFIIHAGIDNRKVSEAVNLTLKELKKVKDYPVGRAEFKRAKEFYIGQLKLGLEDTMEHMLWVGENAATLGKSPSLEEIIEEVNKVRQEDISIVAQKAFREDNLNLALIGPLKSVEDAISKRISLK
ncbi:MAG: pitrilysin family protein [Candidatus Omnitrophota bacterium]